MAAIVCFFAEQTVINLSYQEWVGGWNINEQMDEIICSVRHLSLRLTLSIGTTKHTLDNIVLVVQMAWVE